MDGQTDVPVIRVQELRLFVNFYSILRVISSLTQRFIMYLNGIKHNVVTKLNPQSLNVGSDRRTDRGMTDEE